MNTILSNQHQGSTEIKLEGNMVSSEQWQTLKHLRKKFLDRKEFKKNNV
jgi:hypothetical protein